MFVLLFLPIAAVLYALPLLFGWVSPNRFFGFRNAKTQANPQLWYRANRIAGVYLGVAMLVCVALEFAVPGLHRGAASHIAALIVQISGLIIANALITFRVLQIGGMRGVSRPQARR